MKKIFRRYQNRFAQEDWRINSEKNPVKSWENLNDE